MLRIFTSRCSNLLLKNAVVASQKEIRSFQLPNTLCTPSIPVYHICTGNPAKNDASEGGGKNKETEAVDLDKWKSVMTSQATFQVQRLGNEVEQSEELGGLKQTGADSNDSSSMEATRELVSMWRLAGKLVPQELTELEMQTLAGLATKTSRKKYLKYLSLREKYKLAHKEKQKQKKIEREAFLQEKREMSGEDDQQGHKLKNTMFLQFWDKSMDKLVNWRAANAMIFGQPLVFDMSYDSNMSKRELENAVSQLMKVEGFNRRATDPFHLHFCNVQPDGLYEKELVKQYGAKMWEHLLITSTKQQYIDLFPREQLVYLTADSPNVLRTFDKSKVYIIGGLVDRSLRPGTSLANAKRLKLATARLPLDEFLDWDLGSKNLTLDQMLNIMLTIKDTGKWQEALEFVPKRKHDGFCHQQTVPAKTSSYTNRVWWEDEDELIKSDKRDRGGTFQSQNAFKKFGFVGGKNTPETKVRASFKSKMEARKSANSSKTRWQDE
ncbi:tRNA methyltransferase 10 homolog C-like [Nematolebias whitei]|uniref:tRNA methyltransferase 10 homolog C-like n=1 Tax=Nematolebias whitei TaxID=451745 RepID=UPI001896B203|nr:tRNA methyltransferase 10 homolog C-like [Nematolebias whitei]